MLLTNINIWIQLLDFHSNILDPLLKLVAPLKNAGGLLGQLPEQILGMSAEGAEFSDNTGQGAVGHALQLISNIRVNPSTADQDWFDYAFNVWHDAQSLDAYHFPLSVCRINRRNTISLEGY